LPDGFVKRQVGLDVHFDKTVVHFLFGTRCRVKDIPGGCINFFGIQNLKDLGLMISDLGFQIDD
jgi:hypothetical protein